MDTNTYVKAAEYFSILLMKKFCFTTFDYFINIESTTNYIFLKSTKQLFDEIYS